MFVLEVTFDSAESSSETINTVAHGGRIIAVSGLLNDDWDEYSARELARECGFVDVDWEVVADDTPGQLTVTVEFVNTLPIAVKANLRKTGGIVDFDLGWRA